MSRLGLSLLFLFIGHGLVGCTVHRHYGRPYAYGVHPTDWVIEEQAQTCAASCAPLSGDARFLCMSQCPGFVTAEVATCRDVPEWHECAIAYEIPAAPPRPPADDSSEGEHQLGQALAVGTVRLLGALITAALEADADDPPKTRQHKASPRPRTTAGSRTASLSSAKHHKGTSSRTTKQPSKKKEKLLPWQGRD